MTFMTCRNVTELASDYLNRDLPRLTRLRVRLHLFMCVRCRRFVRQLKTTVLAVAAMADPTPLSSPAPEELDALAEYLRQTHDEGRP